MVTQVSVFVFERERDRKVYCMCVQNVPSSSLRNQKKNIELNSNFISIRQWVIFLTKIFLKTERACASTIIFAAIDFSLQNISGVYLS